MIQNLSSSFFDNLFLLLGVNLCKHNRRRLRHKTNAEHISIIILTLISSITLQELKKYEALA